MTVDHSLIDRIVDDLEAALAALPTTEAAAQRFKFFSMLSKNPGLLVVSKWKLSPAVPAYNIERASLEPTQFFLDAVAAVRAGNLDWDVELAGE